MSSIKYFETIRCEDYEALNLPYHQKRVANTVALNIDLNEYIYAPSEDLYRCKLIYDESGVLDMEFFPYKKRDIRSFKIVYDNSIEYNKKYLNRDCLDRLYKKKDGCDEIIIVKNGLITDTSIANIAIYYKNRWLTGKKPLLYGTTRERYLNQKDIFECYITLDMLYKSEKIALMNAMIGFDILDDYSFFS
ncbi:MAG: aminotransferase class IV [Campylobacterota bacterium]